MSTSEPELSPVVAGANGLRTGWTTGTCASAAAKAAALWLRDGQPPATVEVELPDGRRVSFPTADIDLAAPNRVAVVKDAGDDPDCTDGAHITAELSWAEPTAFDQADPVGSGGIELISGPGVGTVTLPGLGIEVGGPALNPVPIRMIGQAVREVTARPVRCVISVPGGEQMAARTSNARLGIIGGISILGTTGVVKPFSTASYRAAVVQQVDVAAARGVGTIVLSTGSRTDDWAQRQWPGLDPVCFVEVGDFTGIALRRAAGRGLREVRFVGMAGKIAKLAAGIMMTHFHRSKVDTALLASVARACQAPGPVVEAAEATNTARHFCEVCVANGFPEPLTELCRLAAQSCRRHANGTLTISVTMTDFHGTEVLAHA